MNFLMKFLNVNSAINKLYARYFCSSCDKAFGKRCINMWNMKMRLLKQMYGKLINFDFMYAICFISINFSYIKPEIGWFIQGKKTVYVPTWLYERTKINGAIIEDNKKRVWFHKLLIETEKLIFTPDLLQTPQLTQHSKYWHSSLFIYNPQIDFVIIHSLKYDIEKAKF